MWFPVYIGGKYTPAPILDKNKQVSHAWSSPTWKVDQVGFTFASSQQRVHCEKEKYNEEQDLTSKPYKNAPSLRFSHAIAVWKCDWQARWIPWTNQRKDALIGQKSTWEWSQISIVLCRVRCAVNQNRRFTKLIGRPMEILRNYIQIIALRSNLQ